MNALETGLPLLAAIASFALPSAAMAESLVPPGNSAAAQYTETFPTAGGQQQAGKGSRSPAKILGTRNTRKLNARGAQGRAAAAAAAATAPSVALGNTPGARAPAGRGGHVGGMGDSGSSQSLPAGSSPLGEVLAQATGSSSSGQMGALLPLVIIGAVAWSLTYLLRRRKRSTA